MNPFFLAAVIILSIFPTSDKNLPLNKGDIIGIAGIIITIVFALIGPFQIQSPWNIVIIILLFIGCGIAIAWSHIKKRIILRSPIVLRKDFNKNVFVKLFTMQLKNRMAMFFLQ